MQVVTKVCRTSIQMSITPPAALAHRSNDHRQSTLPCDLPTTPATDFCEQSSTRLSCLAQMQALAASLHHTVTEMPNP